MMARRCSTFWNLFRAMSCFKRAFPNSIRIVTGIFGLQERPRVRVLLRRDLFHRFYSCLVFVPREKYNTQVRQRIERVIREAFSAFSMESQVQIAESNLARIHIVARTAPTESAHVDADVLERRVAAAVRSWLDSFKAALLARFDEAYALQLFDKYAQDSPRPTPRTSPAKPRPWMCPFSRRWTRNRRACTWISTGRIPSARRNSS